MATKPRQGAKWVRKRRPICLNDSAPHRTMWQSVRCSPNGPGNRPSGKWPALRRKALSPVGCAAPLQYDRILLRFRASIIAAGGLPLRWFLGAIICARSFFCQVRTSASRPAIRYFFYILAFLFDIPPPGRACHSPIFSPSHKIVSSFPLSFCRSLQTFLSGKFFSAPASSLRRQRPLVPCGKERCVLHFSCLFPLSEI